MQEDEDEQSFVTKDSHKNQGFCFFHFCDVVEVAIVHKLI
jgi:hypothetical protein